MKYLFFTLLFISSVFCFGQKKQINKDLEIEKLTDKIYFYTSWSDIGEWGRVGSNGIVIIDNGKALLCDTPADVQQTKDLFEYVTHSLNARISLFVPNHWHGDCVAGLEYLNEQGVESYANKMTNDILESKSLPVAKHSFTDSLFLNLEQIPVECYYLGGGHATDNIVVWLPSEKILFGGCMVKDMSSTVMGNTSDAAPLPEWLSTIETVETKFPDARIVIPGHGQYGDRKLLDHTKELIRRNL